VGDRSSRGDWYALPRYETCVCICTISAITFASRNPGDVSRALQPPMIEHIQSIPADAEGAVDYTGSDSANIDVSSSHPNSPTQTTQTSEPSIIQDLVNHYSGELPEYETNLEKASDIASDEVMTETPNNMHLT